MPSPLSELVIYAALWGCFGLLHSGMATNGFKRVWCRWLGPFACLERLLFNLVSLVAFAMVQGYGYYHLPTTPLFQPGPLLAGVLLVLQGIGVILFLWSLSTYDLSRFAGLRQIASCRKQVTLAPEPLVLSPLHRYTRHPIYSAMLLILWARPWDEAVFATNLCATLYLLVGISLEEKKLLALYGLQYQHLQQTVPKLLPFRRFPILTDGQSGSNLRR